MLITSSYYSKENLYTLADYYSLQSELYATLSKLHQLRLENAPEIEIEEMIETAKSLCSELSNFEYDYTEYLKYNPDSDLIKLCSDLYCYI